MVGFSLNFSHLFLGQIPGRALSLKKKKDFRAWGQAFCQNEAKTLEQFGDFKNGRIWMKLTHLFLRQILPGDFSFFKNCYFGAWRWVLDFKLKIEFNRLVGFRLI